MIYLWYGFERGEGERGDPEGRRQEGRTGEHRKWEGRVREVIASLMQPDPCMCGRSGIIGFVPQQPRVQYQSDYRISDYYCITSCSLKRGRALCCVYKYIHEHIIFMHEQKNS